MNLKFGKKITSTAIILAFGAVITVSALSTKNLGADEKRKSTR